jgi:hypothetical protein
MVLLRAAWAQKEREALSSDDLTMLEESAVLLIEQLKEETDQRLTELRDYTVRLETLLHEADARITELQAQLQFADFAKAAISPNALAPTTAHSISTETSINDAHCIPGHNCAEEKLIRRLAVLQAR